MSSYSLPALLHKRVTELSFHALVCNGGPVVRTKKAWIEVSTNWHLKHDLDTKARLIWLEITIRTKKNENVVSFHIVVGVKTVHKATLQSRPSSFSLPATLHTGRQGKITPELFCEGGPEDCTMTSPRRDLYLWSNSKFATHFQENCLRSIP